VTAVYTFIAEEQADPACEWHVTEMCRVLEVSRSGFYDWQAHVPSARELEDRVLAREIELIYIASGETYGVPRMTHWLRQQGFTVNAKRVGRIMREQGLEGESGRRRVKTTIVDKRATAASDHVRRDFNPPAPDVVWCGDITYLHTGEGWLYVATVIDLFSRRVIGWAAADHMRTELVADALDMAVATRGGHIAGVVFHSDRGSVYTSSTFGELCGSHGIVQSMGATGVCWDNSVAESWFGTMKRELAHRRRWATRAEARRVLIRWIEGWFNSRRLHSSNNYNSPIDWENLYYRRGDGIAA
jgi:transposase InsO family protein